LFLFKNSVRTVTRLWARWSEFDSQQEQRPSSPSMCLEWFLDLHSLLSNRY